MKALVISFEAPTTSPLTPPNALVEITSRTSGTTTMITAAATSFRGESGNNTRGRQRMAARILKTADDSVRGGRHGYPAGTVYQTP